MLKKQKTDDLGITISDLKCSAIPTLQQEAEQFVSTVSHLWPHATQVPPGVPTLASIANAACVKIVSDLQLIRPDARPLFFKNALATLAVSLATNCTLRMRHDLAVEGGMWISSLERELRECKDPQQVVDEFHHSSLKAITQWRKYRPAGPPHPPKLVHPSPRPPLPPGGQRNGGQRRVQPCFQLRDHGVCNRGGCLYNHDIPKP